MDTAQPVPAYYRLKRRLLEEIEAGRYGHDGRLPTEHELCSVHGLSRTPVARALTELAAEGVVVRHRRRGTFVNPEWMRTFAGAPEVSVLVCEGGWAGQLREAAGRDLRLNIATTPFDDLRGAFRRAIAEGRGPDLAVVDSVWVAEFADAHMLTPISELDPEWTAEEHDRDFLPPFAAAYRLDQGRSVAVQAPADVAGLWYERAALDRMGAAPPLTWRDLRTVGTALAEGLPRGRSALVMPGGPAGGETTAYALTALLVANGATVLGPGGVTLNGTATVETLRFLRVLVDRGVLSAETVSYDRHQAERMLATGRAALCVGASYQAEQLSTMTGLPLSKVPERFGFVPIPAGPNGPPAILCGGMVYCIPRQARRPDLAMRLLRRVMEPARLAHVCARTGQVPPRRSAVDALVPGSEFHTTTAHLLEQAVTRPLIPVYALVSAQLQTMLQDVLTRRSSPEAAAALTADRISAITGLPTVTP
jgi:ABC-type glycerol-3-phosphate transport system substrate-binding protein